MKYLVSKRVSNLRASSRMPDRQRNIIPFMFN
jgi:hypothetical protein